MKIKHFVLGAAIVALMAACGGKQATETTTETPAEGTSTEIVAEETATEAEPVAETPAPAKSTKQETKTTAKKEETKKPAVDPCEAKVKAFEKYVDQLKEAKNNKAKGATAMKAYADLKKQAASMEQTIKDCTSNPEYKTRLNNAIMAEKKLRS